MISNYSSKLSDEQKANLSDLISEDQHLIYISFGSPYHGLQVSGLKNFICTYYSDEFSQRAAADVLLGILEPKGKLPISVYKNIFATGAFRY